MFKNLSEKPIAEVQKEQVAKWKEEDLLGKCISTREGMPAFNFYEGPPTANGKPGIHHVMARTLKDSVNRYKTMQGYQVHRKAGWDTHGLPVEIEVEKQLKMSGKQDIEKYGIKEFNEKCRESVFTYTDMWEQMSDRMAYMADMENPYITTTISKQVGGSSRNSSRQALYMRVTRYFRSVRDAGQDLHHTRLRRATRKSRQQLSQQNSKEKTQTNTSLRGQLPLGHWRQTWRLQ